MNKLIKFTFIILIFTIAVRFFLPFTVVKADGCSIGAFNYDDKKGVQGSSDCPWLGINDPSADVIRNWGVSDEYDIAEKMQGIPDGKYVMPQNEPNLESEQSPKQVADNIKLWVDQALAQGKHITIVIPSYAHNQGSINGDALSQQEAVIAELYNSGYLSKGINFVMGINAYGNTQEVLNMVQAQQGVASKYGINNVILTEVAIATHHAVQNGDMSVAEWMHDTAKLVMDLQKTNLKGTWMFTSLLLDGAQIPLYINPDTGEYYFGCGDNLIKGNVNGSVTNYSGNITDLGCGSPGGVWGPLEGLPNSDVFCSQPEEYSGALNCIDCAVKEDIAPSNLSFLARLKRVFTSPFGVKGYAFEMTLDSFESPVTKLNDENGKLFSGNESDIAFFWGGSYDYKDSFSDNVASNTLKNSKDQKNGENYDIAYLSNDFNGSKNKVLADYIKNNNNASIAIPKIPNLLRLFDPELAEKYRKNIENAKAQEDRTVIVRATPDHAVTEEDTEYVNSLKGLAGDLNLSISYPTANCDVATCYKLSELTIDLTSGNHEVRVPGGTVIWPTGSNYEYTILGRDSEYDPKKGEKGPISVIGGSDITRSQKVDGIGLSSYNPDPTTNSNHQSYTAIFVECHGNADCKSSDLAGAVKPVTKRKSAQIVAQVEHVIFAAEGTGAIAGALMNTPEKYVTSGTVLGISKNDLYSQVYLNQKQKAVAQMQQEFLSKNYSYEDIINLTKAKRGVVANAPNSNYKKVKTLEANTEVKKDIEQSASFNSSLCTGAKKGPKGPACSKDFFPQKSVIVENLDNLNCSTNNNGEQVCDSANDVVNIGVDVTIGCYSGESCGDPTEVTPSSSGKLAEIFKDPPVSKVGLIPLTTIKMLLSSYVFKPGQDINPAGVFVKHSPQKVDFNPVAEDIEKQVGKTVYPNHLLTAQELALPEGSYRECGGKMLYTLNTNPDADIVANPETVPLGKFTRKTKEFFKSYDCYPSRVDDFYDL